MDNATDWDAYYSKPAGAASVTRKISEKKILRTLADRLSAPGVTVCELGGANSCFADAFLESDNVAAYHVVDSNAYGVGLLREKYASDGRVSGEIADALAIQAPSAQYDIVYSVGLIEHFDEAGTAKCVAAHFELCRPGGVVLVTFPTPTFPYKIIRGLAESLNKWNFPDERPLGFDEVLEAVGSRGRLTHKSINWLIGLTQGYVLCEKQDGDQALRIRMNDHASS